MPSSFYARPTDRFAAHQGSATNSGTQSLTFECTVDVSDIANKLEESLSLAMEQLDNARSHLIAAAHWRDNLFSVSRRLAENDEGQCGRYIFMATMLSIIGREFDGAEAVPFAALAEVYGVVGRELPHLRFSEYEKSLFAFKIIREHVASRSRIDALQETRVVRSIIRGFLDRLYHGTEILHGR
ncbi:hypothetical protein GALMADRAFT_213559 [Galerina marginata CBS 339.88]|uniref:Uncharacterized protein n=1 Tax=Galerina marginata (strain CBS 339.88) TaxID=685588 RepID=A0A067SWQ8_GALM3|nr:hypothetical protein GALMADRAFT_213559 [Galerina marginata CBS 339.88]